MKSIRRITAILVICIFTSNLTGLAITTKKKAVPKKTTNAKTNSKSAPSKTPPVKKTPARTDNKSISKVTPPASSKTSLPSIKEIEVSEIEIPANSDLSEVQKHLGITLDISDGTKIKSQVIRWNIPDNLSTKVPGEYYITGNLEGSKLIAKAHLKIVEVNSSVPVTSPSQITQPAKPTVVNIEKPEIEIPTNSSFDEVQKHLEITLNMSDGTKAISKVEKWNIPSDFSTLNPRDYDITGNVSDSNLIAKAHLKVIEIGKTTPDAPSSQVAQTAKSTVTDIEVPEISIPAGSSFDEVQKHLDITLKMSDGTKIKSNVISWNMPSDFSSLSAGEYELTGNAANSNLIAKAHLKVVASDTSKPTATSSPSQSSVSAPSSETNTYAAEIEIPTNTMFDEVQKHLEVTFTNSDGIKTKSQVTSWSMPDNFTSMVPGEYILTGKVLNTDVIVKAHLKIVGPAYGITSQTQDGTMTNGNSVFNGTLLDNDARSIVVESDEQLAYDIAGRISNPKYGGRLAGTDAYNSAAAYVASVFKELHLFPAGDNNTYLEGYKCNIAQFTSMPVLSIDGKPLEIFKDFKPHGNTGAGTISGNREIFVGYGYPEDYKNIDVNGKIVVFLSALKNNIESGVMDRMIYAKKMGASAVLMLPNQYMSMTTFEKPLKYSDSGIVSEYISKDILNSLGFSENTPIGAEENKVINGITEIKRTANTTGYNVLGLIHGKDISKTVVLSASLDSYGSLPNGTTFDGASTSASGIGSIIALAKYYTIHQPGYNILIAAFGGQAVGMEGSNAFVNSYTDINKVAANIDLYDVGSLTPMNTIFDSVGSQYSDLHNSVAKYTQHIIDIGPEVNYPFGNNYQFSTKGIANVFVRYADSNESFKDTFSNVSKLTLSPVINQVKNILNDFMKGAAYTAPITTVDQSKITREFVPTINKSLNVYETAYTKIYWEDTIPLRAIEELVKNADDTYIQDLWWNYYPDTSKYGKVKIYCVSPWEEGYLVVNRKDKFGSGEKGGGYQSFDDCALSIVRNEENTASGNYDLLGTFAHEFNHVCANLNKMNTSDSQIDNQEISGHVYTTYASFLSDDRRSRSFFKFTVPDLAAGNDISKIDWSEYTENNNSKLKTSDQWQTHYNRLASLEYYIWQTYGADITRDIQYDFYQDPRPSVQSVLEAKLHKDFKTIVVEWYNFYQ